MNLTDILSTSRVVNGLCATSKKKALEALSQLLCASSEEHAQSDIFESLTSREKLGSTGLGHGVAIPHGRIHGIGDSIAAFIRLQQPVEYDAHDGIPVDLILGLLVPEECTDTHLRHLAAVADIFSNEAYCSELRDAGDSSGLYKLLSNSAFNA